MSQLNLLFNMRWKTLRNLNRIVSRQSSFKVLFILGFSAFMLFGLWWVFYSGFVFVDRLGGVGMIVIPRLFSFFFLSLTAMLILSSILTTYTTLYRSEEIPYLLLNPLSLSDLIIFKHVESAFFASWAFFFIIIPFVGAYAWYENMPWYFSVWTLIFSIPFTFLCSSIGILITILMVRFVPRTRRFWGPAILLLCAYTLWWWVNRVPLQNTRENAILMINRFVPFLGVASWPLQPGWWISEGILSVTRGQWTRGAIFFTLLLSNGLFLALCIEWCGRRFFYDGWQRTLSTERRAQRRQIMLRRSEALFRWLPSDFRALIFKDIRIFLRDPQQWIQAVFFFGMLAVYFFSLGNLHYRSLPPVWKNIITFLNVFSIACVLCSLSSRFIYPQMSLEGQAFWIIGMAPTTMWRVLFAKFLLSFFSMLIISAGLMTISTGMLDVPQEIRHMSVFIAVCISAAVAGLSTGNGAIFIDLKQRNTSAIVSGFGGTLNLVLCLAFMLLCIFPTASLFHAKQMGRIGPLLFDRLHGGMIGALSVATLLCTFIPLLIARKSLMNRDY
jgi:ABC-2 type transport system permease protein